jgi:hypothetical protein
MYVLRLSGCAAVNDMSFMSFIKDFARSLGPAQTAGSTTQIRFDLFSFILSIIALQSMQDEEGVTF